MIELATPPFGVTYRPRFISHRADLKPPFGGRWDVLGRMGSHFAVGVQLPRILLREAAMAWIADLILAETDTALLPWPQDPDLRGRLDSVVVDGGGQAGTTLALRGGRAGAFIRKGQFVSLKVEVSEGVFQRFLHMAAARATFDAAGEAALSIHPMLRVSPPDGAAVEIETPMIEGRIAPGVDWDVDELMSAGLAFEIEEAA